jgi:hypothetical protein
MNKIAIFAALAAAFVLSGCDVDVGTSDQIQNAKQEELSKQGVESVGLPAITHFQEKRILKDILELRDQPNLVTYTYTQDMNGRYHKVCDSIGYGFSAATQYTSPSKVASYARGGVGNILPQADPNGLFSPPSADGTWVLCKVPGKDEVKPLYIEPHVIVSPFPLSM